MPFVCTAAEHKLLDQSTTRDCQFPAILLMENAGRAVAGQAEKLCPEGGHIVILCGSGNNAGDGFVAARVLCDLGYDILVLLFTRDSHLRNEAKQSYDMLRFGCPSCYPGMRLEYVPEQPDENWLAGHLLRADLLIDAMVGISLSRPLAGNMATVAQYCNDYVRHPVLAVDVPSGLSCDSGAVYGPVVKASETVTFGALKPGLLLQPAASFAGKVTLADIGIPRYLYQHMSLKGQALNDFAAGRLLPERPRMAHKGTFGHVVVVGGSVGKAGALALCAQGALRSGVGLCSVASSPEALATIRDLPAEVMTIPYQSPELRNALPQTIIATVGRRGAVAVGPGWDCGPNEAGFLADLFQAIDKPIVLDASALGLLAQDPKILPVGKRDVVLTPHPGEMASLTRLSVQEIVNEPLKAAQHLALQYRVTVVLKGAPTVIVSPDGLWTINTTGNNGLATGGSGDLLTGIITSLLSQGLPGYQAAVLGCYLHGLAADIASQKTGAVSLLPSDVALSLGQAIKQLEQVK